MLQNDAQARYRSLVVTTCEWRAFELDDPEAMADRVFARVAADAGKPRYLRRLYTAVEDVVIEAYRDSAGQGSLWEHFAGLRGGPTRPAGTPEERLRTIFTKLPTRDVEVLRQAFWDTLTPDEMAEVNGGSPASQAAKVAAALARFKTKLPASAPGDPAEAVRSIKPGTHWRGV